MTSNDKSSEYSDACHYLSLKEKKAINKIYSTKKLKQNIL
jgi:hypothetical protein